MNIRFVACLHTIIMVQNKSVHVLNVANTHPVQWMGWDQCGLISGTCRALSTTVTTRVRAVLDGVPPAHAQLQAVL